MLERDPKRKVTAQQLRKNPTKEEAILWRHFLSTYPVRFRRQLVIGPYIVDFYCHLARLVVELDGSQHCEPEKMERDVLRTQYLQSKGLKVVRFSNFDVLRNFEGVCQALDTIVQTRMTHIQNASPGGKLSSKARLKRTGDG